MIYDVYAGGIHAVQAELRMDMSDPQHYALSLDAHTRGFLGALVPWNGSFESTGWVMAEGDYQPEMHQSTAVWRKETEVKSYHYNKDGSFKGLRIKDHDKPAFDKKVDAELTHGTIDVLTATLEAMWRVGQGGDCAGQADIFDGKRRFVLKFTPKDKQHLTPSKYNIFEGDAQRCTAEVIPDGGAWHEKPRGWMSIQEQGRKKGTMPTIWMGKVNENGPAVPIKILVKTDYGALFMHLAEYRDGAQSLVAEKREELR